MLAWKGLVTFYTLLVIDLRSCSVHVCGTTVSPNAQWMRQVARQLVDGADGFARKTHLNIDRDTKYADGFRELLESAGLKIVLCPPRVPQCNAYAESLVRSIKEECLSRLVFFSEGHLRKTISIFIGHYRHGRNQQGIENKLTEPPKSLPKAGRIRCQKELGGLSGGRVTHQFCTSPEFFGDAVECVPTGVGLPPRPIPRSRYPGPLYVPLWRTR